MSHGLTVDLFAGGGGASIAIEAATGRSVDVAINHNDVALAVHEANHPHTKHFVSDVWEIEPLMATRGRPVFLLWASPSCTHFSRARSGIPRSNQERSHADVVIKWAKQTNPEFIFIENVPEFLTWGPLDESGHPLPLLRGALFLRWKERLEALGYSVDWRVLDSSAYGAPTRRRRLFVVSRRDGALASWPTPSHGPGLEPYRSAMECIDFGLPIPSVFGRKRPLAEKTLARIAEGVRRFVLDTDSPVVVPGLAPLLIQTGYGERDVKHALMAVFLTKHFTGAYGQPLTLPASTITAIDHHALTTVSLVKLRGTSAAGGVHVAAVGAMLSRFGVTPKPIIVDGEHYGIGDIGMRMLEPHELLAAQFGRFAASYDMSAAGTKSAKVRLIGNSVPPEVAVAVVRANVSSMENRKLAMTQPEQSSKVTCS